MYFLLIIFSFTTEPLFPLCYKGYGLKKGEKLISFDPLIFSITAISNEIPTISDFSFSVAITDKLQINYYNLFFITIFDKEYDAQLAPMFHILSIKNNLFLERDFSPFFACSFGKLCFLSTSDIFGFHYGISKKSNSHIFHISANFLLFPHLENPIMWYFHSCLENRKNILMEGLIGVTNGRIWTALGTGIERRIKRFYIKLGCAVGLSTTKFFIPIIRIGYLL